MKLVLFAMLILLSASTVFAESPEQKLLQKLKSTRIKHIEYEDAAIDDVIGILQQQVKTFDPTGKGINMIVAVAKGKKPEDYRVTLNMNNIPLYHALDYITKSADMQFFLKGSTVVIASKEIAKEGMEIRTYKVKPHVVSTLKRVYPEAKIKGKGNHKELEPFDKDKKEIFE